jgi:hypothetical protein
MAASTLEADLNHVHPSILESLSQNAKRKCKSWVVGNFSILHSEFYIGYYYNSLKTEFLLTISPPISVTRFGDADVKEDGLKIFRMKYGPFGTHL